MRVIKKVSKLGLGGTGKLVSLLAHQGFQQPKGQALGTPSKITAIHLGQA